MTPESADRARALREFERVAELGATEREEALAALAQASAGLADEVRALLAADADSGLLDRTGPAAAMAAERAAAAALDRSGQTVGAYRLLECVGRGGMGDVYRAERSTAAFHQTVAIKLLRRGLDSEDLLARFAQERRILARLDHPNIARLIDGGIIEGTPYLVLDFIDGTPLTTHAQQQALDLRARLGLFATMCRAVEAAHRMLIVHRDLKPSNVLVTRDGQVKLLDFGIAKLLDADEPDTRTTRIAFTPDYAAPEQLTNDPVSTATDVFALGVILHELLTGDLPRFASDATGDRSPCAPSKLLARQRNAQTQTTARDLVGDLDTLVLKALHPEPQRRYPSAHALADDLQRFLDGRPISARPDTFGYRVGKFIRRHRGGVAAGLLSLAGIVVALMVAVWQAREARQQAAAAQAQLRRAETIKDFTLSLFREQDPLDRARAKARTAAELVAQGLDQAGQDFAADPRLAADIVGDLAQIQSNLGDLKPARAHFAQVMEWRRETDGERSIGYAVALGELGGVDLALGQREPALAAIERAVQLLRELAGPDDVRTARAEMRLVRLRLEQGQPEAALTLARHALAVHETHYGPDHLETLRRHYNLGVVLEQLDRLDEAEVSLRRALDGYVARSGVDHVQTVYPRVMLADLMRRQRRYAEALPLYADAIAAARASVGAAHPVIGQSAMRLGDLLRRMRRYDEAAAALDEAEQIFRPLGSPELGQVLVFKGRLALARGQAAQAIPHYEHAVEVYARTLGPQNAFTLSARTSLGEARIEAGDLARGTAELEENAKLLTTLPGIGQAEIAYAAERLALAYAANGRYVEAIAESGRAAAALKSMYGEDHSGYAENVVLATGIALDAGRVDPQSLPRLQRAMDVLEREDAAHAMIGEALVARGRLRARAGDKVAARADVEAGLARLTAEYAPEHRLVRAARALLAEWR
jgi:tetratricopeptide (TPR) repeat protein